MSAAAMSLPAAPRNSAPAAPSPTKHRWLYVVSHTEPRYGGLSSAVPSLGASLGRSDALDVRLAAFCHPDERHLPAALEAEQVSFWPTSRKTWLLDREVKTSFAEVVQQADGLHVHGLWEESTAAACRAARQLGKPYILSAHGMLEPWALNAKRLKKRVYAAMIERSNVAGATCLHALTAAEAQQYRNFGATCPVAIVPNAVELPVDAHPELFVDRFPQLRGKRIVLFLSRLHPKKGLDLLLQAWGVVAQQYPEAHLVIAGPNGDGMQARLEAQAVELSIGRQTCFPGMLAGEMKWSALAAAEGYVLPSYSEGLSMALLEAMGMGLPVIATRACNMPEIAEADAGWEIDATAEAVADALHQLLSRPAEQNWARGRNGAQLIASRYTPEQVTRQMAAVYAFALGGPRPAWVEPWDGGPR